jgi:predicted nucleotidyltransferase
MILDKTLDGILNTGSKVKIIRLFISRREDFMTSGRQIARLTGITAPAAHTALKELYNQDILKCDVIGREHIYRLNANNRIVKHILKPAFKKEQSLKRDIFSFLRKRINRSKFKDKVLSVILYGSFESGSANEKSDVDIAVISKDKSSKRKIEQKFLDDISNQFYDYFGLHLDVYVNTKEEFAKKLKKNLPPVSTLIQSYSVIYGRDPIEFEYGT